MYQPTHQQKKQSDVFKALSDPTRLAIFEMLQSACCPALTVDEETREVRPVVGDGPTLGEVCCRLTGAERVTSSFSRHFKELADAGLVVLERRGKSVVCALNPEGVASLAGYLDAARAACCCGGGGEDAPGSADCDAGSDCGGGCEEDVCAERPEIHTDAAAGQGARSR